MESLFASVFDIQHFCTHDGPGIRTTLFLKGCPLRCRWCHNPEGQQRDSELFLHPTLCIDCQKCVSVCPMHDDPRIRLAQEASRRVCCEALRCVQTCPSGAIERVGTRMELSVLLEKLLEDRLFYETSGGGVTISGGEPLFQAKEVTALLRALKAERIHTVVETCGYGSNAMLQAWIPFVDLFLWDLKNLNPQAHLRDTGVPLTPILENLFAADAAGAKLHLRTVFIPELHNAEALIKELRNLRKQLSSHPLVEVLPYHPLGLSKYVQLGRDPVSAFKEPSLQSVSTIEVAINAPI